MRINLQVLIEKRLANLRKADTLSNKRKESIKTTLQSCGILDKSGKLKSLKIG